jgi:hypothetical protein
MERACQPRQSRGRNSAAVEQSEQASEFLDTIILPLTGLTSTLLLIAHYADADMLRQMFAL